MENIMELLPLLHGTRAAVRRYQIFIRTDSARALIPPAFGDAQGLVGVIDIDVGLDILLVQKLQPRASVDVAKPEAVLMLGTIPLE